MQTALIIYVVLGLMLALVLYGSGVISDIKSGPDHKFGYNYKSRVVWSLCGLVGVPVVNILFLLLLIWIWIDARYKAFMADPQT